jgi:hypothetical protein
MKWILRPGPYNDRRSTASLGQFINELLQKFAVLVHAVHCQHHVHVANEISGLLCRTLLLVGLAYGSLVVNSQMFGIHRFKNIATLVVLKGMYSLT